MQQLTEADDEADEYDVNELLLLDTKQIEAAELKTLLYDDVNILVEIIQYIVSQIQQVYEASSLY
jgi:hypothetical protein